MSDTTDFSDGLMQTIFDEEKDRLPQNDPRYGNMFDGMIEGQGSTVRPRDYGYYEMLPEQRFSQIMSNYIVIMLALENNDITDITDEQWTYFAWGMNDQDALDAGYRFAAEEGWLTAYTEWFVTENDDRVYSEITRWPRYGGENNGRFEEIVNAQLASIETVDRASRVPQATVWRTITKDTFGIGGTPGTAQWGFNAALHGGNMSELQQGIEKNVWGAVRLGTYAAGAFMGGNLILGAAKSSTIAAPMLAKVTQTIASTPAGKKVIRLAQKGWTSLFGRAPDPGVVIDKGVATLNSESIAFAEGTNKLFTTPSVTALRPVLGASAVGSVGLYGTSMVLGWTVDTESDLFDDLKLQIDSGAVSAEAASLIAAAISGMTGEPIPQTLLGLDGFEDFARDKDKYEENRALATEKLKEQILKPIMESLFPERPDTPQPVTGDAADWEDSLILASAFGIDLFARTSETDLDAKWGVEPETPEDGTDTSTTTTSTTPDVTDGVAPDVSDDEYQGQIDAESTDGTGGFGLDGEGGPLTAKEWADLTPPERNAAIDELLASNEEAYKAEFLAEEGNADATDEEIAEAVTKAGIQQRQILLDQVMPFVLENMQAEFDASARERQLQEQLRGPVVGGLDPYAGINPTITAPRDPRNLPFNSALGKGDHSGSALEEFERQDYEGQTGTYMPRYYSSDIDQEMGDWSIAKIEWFQERAIDAGMINPEAFYQPGQRDAITRNAFAALVEDANNNGNTWEDQLQGNIDAYTKWKDANPDTSGRNPYTAFVAPTYLIPDYATLAVAAKSQAQRTLGRRLSKAEMSLLTNELRDSDQEQWDSSVQAERQTHAARARAYDDVGTGGGGEQTGGTAQGVDSEARFKQFFDDKFSGEIKHRERVNQAQSKNAGFFGSIANVERNL